MFEHNKIRLIRLIGTGKQEFVLKYQYIFVISITSEC